MKDKRTIISDCKPVWIGITAIMLLLAGCTKPGRTPTKPSSTQEDSELWEHRPPTITLFLVPMDGMTTGEVEKLADDFQKNFGDRRFETYAVEVLPHMKSPNSCLNDAKTRLRADKLIKLLNDKYKDECRSKADKKDPGYSEYHVMGVTDRDISTTVHGHADYGVLGLSYLHGPHAGVVSTKRLKRKKEDLWKLTAHEFCHGFYGCPHCKNNDPHCLMADAKGGDPQFQIKDSLCMDCGNVCLIGD